MYPPVSIALASADSKWHGMHSRLADLLNKPVGLASRSGYGECVMFSVRDVDYFTARSKADQVARG